MWDTVYIDIQFSSINIQWYIQLIGVCQSLELKKCKHWYNHPKEDCRFMANASNVYCLLSGTCTPPSTSRPHSLSRSSVTSPAAYCTVGPSMRESRRTTAQSSSFLARLEIHEIHWSYFCHGFAMVLPLKLDELDMLKNQMLLFSCGLLLMMFSSNRCDLKSGSNRQRR